jgi:hypothetical protein
VPKAQAYDITMYVLAGMLVLGLICNLLVRPVADKHFMTDAELAARRSWRTSAMRPRRPARR